MISNEPCPQCRKAGHDTTGDNLVNYGEGMGKHCFACGFSILSDAERKARGVDNYEYDDEEVMTKELITQEEVEKIKSYTGTSGQGCRGITDEVYKAYACRFKCDEETGAVTEVFYPYTEGYKPAGFKVRRLPKEFYSVGKIGKDSELFGQWKWKNSVGRYLLICAGEVDALSAYQMLENYRKGKGSDFDPIPVVSSGIGEAGSYKQIQKHYDWVNNFDKIVVCYDNDDAGKDAVKKLVDVLPKGKMFVMKLSLKDANEYLEKGKEKQFVSLFYSAPAYSPDGIIGSDSLMDKIIEQARTPKIPLPPFMHKVQKEMAGGIPLGVIVNLASASGTGKSTIVDECTYFWVFNSPHRIGVVTLESDSGQYGTKILSRHIGRKIDLIEDVDEKIEFIQSEEVQAKAKELWYNDDGTPRWHLVEERDGGIESLKDLIMNLIIACGCKVIILDPLQDILDGLSNEEQAVFMRWMKGMVKSHQCTFINVNHVRKSGSGQKANSTGANMHEEDIHGSSAILKSGACNLIFTRNKEAEDETEKNTTHMKMSKCRWTGRTGMAGKYYYDNVTHTMHDMDDWLQQNPQQF
jgi:archaellum biogenesis ATPase FlaH